MAMRITRVTPLHSKAKVDPTLILLSVLAILYLIWLVKMWLVGELTL